jgi:oligopeptide/dipeptide ABC transporter ATP-binding protein
MEPHKGPFIDEDTADKRVEEISRRFGLAVTPEARVETITVAQQQRVEILKALFRGAEILILDEPTAVLTPQEAKELFEVIKSLKDEGKSIIFITHKLGEVLDIADRITVLRRGKTVETVPRQGATEEGLAKLMVGREVLLRVEKKRAEPGDALLRVTDLQVHDARGLEAVRGVSFDVRAGETLGLVGESGCGKSTTILEIMGLEPPMGGSLQVLGSDVATLTRADRKRIRRDLQIVFQDPMASLDPRLPVRDLIAEPMEIQGYPKERIAERVPELMRLVGLRPEQVNRYPAEFSGGQRQRICIARALALEPKVLVLDEPVSALDVSIQAGVLNLLDELKARLGLAYLFVAHDLSVVRHIADRVAVMYLGRIVEIGAVDEVFAAPQHPYTQALLSAIPVPDPDVERHRERILLQGDLPSPADPPSGCRFRTRCPLFRTLDTDQQERCIGESPPLYPARPAEPDAGFVAADHTVACHWARIKRVVQPTGTTSQEDR